MVKLIISEQKPQKVFNKDTEKQQAEKLQEIFGKNKKLPRGYTYAALLALSYYPELKDVKIEFVFKETDVTLSAKPTPSTIFLPARKRKYRVVISRKAKSSKQPVMLKNLDFDVQVGVIGHELGHIIDYLHKTSLQIIRDSLMYGIKSHKRKMEKRADKIAIKHGFGYQLLAYAKLVKKLQNDFPEEVYYKDYFKYYCSCKEIEASISKLKLYEKQD